MTNVHILPFIKDVLQKLNYTVRFVYLFMLFSEVLGHDHIKKNLLVTTQKGRIPHAQLFVGPEGCGTLELAIAYVQEILCTFSNDPKSCMLKIRNLSHPDVHFIYPVVNSGKVKSNSSSSAYIKEWRSFVKEKPFGTLFAWYQHLGVENKQGLIGVKDAQEIIRKIALRAYEGGWKAVIVWQADKLNDKASNKLLKLVEEPPDKTVILLVTENEDQIIDTLKSRCQKIQLHALASKTVEKGLIRFGCSEVNAKKIAGQVNGNFFNALQINQDNEKNAVFENWFVIWVRTAFRAKGNKGAVLELVDWSKTISASGRETQKKFIEYAITVFRQALMLNYNVKDLVHLTPNSDFELEKFAPFVHGNNVVLIIDALESASYHIERNGYAQGIFTDLSIQLTRLIHKKNS